MVDKVKTVYSPVARLAGARTTVDSLRGTIEAGNGAVTASVSIRAARVGCDSGKTGRRA